MNMNMNHVQGERVSPVRGNYLAILSFAWAYILSALWGGDATVKGHIPRLRPEG
jgi:hypothetical protein